MPKDRNPWLADDTFPDKKIINIRQRVTVMFLVIIVTLGLFAFMGA